MLHTIFVCCLVTVVVDDKNSPLAALPNPEDADYCKTTFCAQQWYTPDARKYCEYYFDVTVLPSPSSNTLDGSELFDTLEAGVRMKTELSIRTLRDVRARVEDCLSYCDLVAIEVSVLIDFLQRIGNMIDSLAQEFQRPEPAY